ncbi:MAG: HAMP domain-containing histidine kinase [Gammaproteobacteria bacterium]|nr:HAMP domain-containing histidine kinase [Gammaproteobacteria bacterium]NIR84124.1 HAMP domain-containing histidine kinase [Gammaproteobacteria bacterium]NIR89436.1 HAMP domain-containing histidine kinase [Gammaproteobacteria bacterium]NIU05279.1 HAMP domain-containing histidine kinase [Gammaproteobacteria bacterium]NIV52219.1 HAMP domain-containing protein [Gammaproteobacteria bacterium]
MRRLRVFRSFTFRLALLYVALFGASVLGLFGFIYWSTAGYMARQTDATIEAEITGLSERYRLTGLAGLTGLIAERVARDPDGSSIYLLTDGDLHPLLGNLESWPEDARAKDGWLEFRLGKGAPEKANGHKARARRFELRGGFHLLVGRDVGDLQEVQTLIVETLVWGLAITLVMALGGGVMVSRSVTHRIEAINQTSREIMSGDLDRRVTTTGTGDDFDQLTDNLNEMLDQIQSLMEGVRRVSDNIAHDLRTPLARLRNVLETVRSDQLSPEQQRAHVEQAISEADGLLSTFNALLRIARIESGERREGFAEVDLEALLRDVAELYEPLSEEKGQRFAMRLEPGLKVHGDRDLLFQAFANLLDNAIKYTPEDGQIELYVNIEGDCAAVTVADTGPGIAEEHREQVFQRFSRLEWSRSTPGAGLGLSLVGAVAKLHHAQVRLSDNQPGLRADVRLPRVTGQRTI